jgi:dihydrofolate reductase
MSKLIMWNLASLDGFFEGARSWDLDFHQSVWGDELERLSVEQLRSADRLLFGRVTYEGMAAYWQTAKGEVADFMNRLPKLVVSRTLGRADWPDTKLIKDNVVAEIQKLKQQGEGNTLVFGSANLSATLMPHDLFDEVRLGIAPVLLGRGKPLFAASLNRLKLKLLEVRQLSTGCVIVRYQPQAGSVGAQTPAAFSVEE